MKIVYTAEETLRLAKRANNPKRSYLLVNPLQGKHLAVSPRESLRMMQTLGKQLAAEFPEARLVIGFAETATAIGAMAASCFGEDCVYIHTTREPLPENSAVYFEEEHSHAIEQLLYCREMERWLEKTETVIFIDDEISTGKTLLNIIQQLSARFPAFRQKRLAAASILNRLTAENETRLESAGIVSRYLVKLPEADYSRAVEGFRIEEARLPEGEPQSWERVPVSWCSPRKGVLAFDYLDVCCRKSEALLPRFKELLPSKASVLVLGSEECMFPALVLGAVLEQQGGWEVRSHSTTRSPIGISTQAGYPIQEGWKLQSLYDPARTTYLYNLARYDAVILVTEKAEEAGLRTLSQALQAHGSQSQILVGGES